MEQGKASRSGTVLCRQARPMSTEPKPERPSNSPSGPTIPVIKEQALKIAERWQYMAALGRPAKEG